LIYYCTIEKEGNEYIAQFPDMTNVVTCAFSQDEALAMAKEALDGCLECSVANDMDIPAVSFTSGYPIEVAAHIVVALQLRRLRGSMSQIEIANRLGLSYQTYQRLENPRKSNPTVKTLERIARVFNKNINVQFGETHKIPISV
jgi:antitoxin HicB